MINGFKSGWLYFLVRCLLAGVFLYAGVGKVADVEGFARVIGGYGLVPDAFVLPLAWVLPVAEIVIAAGLVWDIKGALSSYTVLLLLFMGVLAHGINMGLDVDCGCFAPGDPEGEAYHSLRESFLRDFFLLCGCAYLYLVRRIAGFRSRSLTAVVSRS